MAKLTAIQMTSVPDVQQNLATIEQQLKQLSITDEHIVVLPECCLYFGGRDKAQLVLAQQNEASCELTTALAKLAAKHQITLVAGSIPLFHPQSNKFTNTCCVFSPSGEMLAQYQKVHLFDVEVQDSERNYLESRYTHPGNELTTLTMAGVTLGLTICYDLRFPELFRALRQLGANVITVPSAFTKVTGQAHWETLLRARAIENQVYIVAAAQVGNHENGRETWGHSMIIDPWGKIITCKQQGVGIISADVDLAHLAKIRQAIPVQEHNQFITKLKIYE
ncbi:carbon-nitrogen hydrolase family protein [Thalassotalea sp. G2M2-11]|uniref:carbon-nitrogen hydrolase family protein n=1 Tax=Thalassotalea sp. G2M2-11 TaxID=2787627 RepID=UPI0019D14B16|nr:carbon-nitrogen hydrolase family protein [Thalassotalea sp. G2M2-11]